MVREAPQTAPPRTRRRRRTRTLRRVVAALLLVPVVAIGAGLLYGWFQWNRIPREESLGELPAPGDVETILLVGSDTRADLADGDARFGAVEGQRADSIVLLVLPPGHQKATMLSIPRDLRVDIPGRGVGKINGAFNGGAPMMVAAVQAATGLSVNHYVEVNFDGFRELSSAVGGVEICVDVPVRDQYSLLDLEAGCHVLTGDSALAWVRARHLERFENGAWRSDPTGDFGRMQRQQEFLQKLLGKMGSPSSVLHLPAIASAAQAAFRIDPGFSYWHALRLGLRFAPSPGAKLQFATLPSEPKNIGGVAYVVPTEPTAGQLLEQLRSGQVPAVEASE
ncbi:MAG: LCP family protein [Acidimicrobiia bacterium]|nr:LCP family protein [Acidimicrobiia bacterium]